MVNPQFPARLSTFSAAIAPRNDRADVLTDERLLRMRIGPSRTCPAELRVARSSVLENAVKDKMHSHVLSMQLYASERAWTQGLLNCLATSFG
jgi:hypothetical protein